jgi:hypothetical protein
MFLQKPTAGRVDYIFEVIANPAPLGPLWRKPVAEQTITNDADL